MTVWPKRSAGRQLYKLHEIVVVVLVQLFACKGYFYSFLACDNFLFHLPTIFALDRGKQSAAGNNVRHRRRVFGEGQRKLNDLGRVLWLCCSPGGASFHALLQVLQG